MIFSAPWMINLLAQADTVAEAAGLSPAVSVAQPTMLHWLGFGAIVTVLLMADLGLFHRESHEPSFKQAAAWTLVWCSLAAAFNVLIYVWRTPGDAIEFLNCYLLEWSLSMDNVFVFAVIFTYFGVPLKYQYRVLFWGILGAVILRLSFILAGAALIQRWNCVLPLAGLFLIYTGIMLATQGDNEVDPERNLLLRLGRKLFPIAKEKHGKNFFAREAGQLCITPLFLVLLVVESTDVVFAVDSVPASFGCSQDPFTIFTSNIFAILGLRALYFMLAGTIDLFRFLKYGLSAVLIFVGLKMVAEYIGEHWWHTEHLIPNWASMGVIVALLGTSVLASVLIPAPPEDAENPSEPKPPA